jgi:predicted DNA-binding transcriptional regulator AlpA
MPTIESLLTTSQVGKLIGKSDRVVREIIKDERVPEPIRLNGSIRFRASTIDQWIRAGCPARDEFIATYQEAKP